MTVRLARPNRIVTQTGWEWGDGWGGEEGGDAFGADGGLAGALDHQRLGEGGDAEFLQLPADVDEFGGQATRTGGVDDPGVALLQRDHLGHPPPVAIVGAREVLQAVDDRSHISLDVVETFDPGAEHEARVHEPTEVHVGVVDRRSQRLGVQPGQQVTRLRGRRQHPGRLVQCVRSEPGRSVTNRRAKVVELGFTPGQLPVIGHDPIDGCSHAVAAQLAEVDVAGSDRQPVVVAELAHDRRSGRRTVEQQQPTHSPTHDPLLQLRGRHHPQRHAVADVEQRRVRLHVHRPIGRLDDARNVAEVPRGDAAPLVDRRGRRDRFANRPGELGLDRIEVGTDGVDRPLVVGHHEVDHQMVGDRRRREGRRRDAHACRRAHGLCERIDERARLRVRRTQVVDHRVDRLAERDEMAPHVLGQRLHECRDELRTVAGNLPVEPLGANLVEARQRHVHGHSVERLARREPVGQGQLDGGVAASLGPHVGVVGEPNAVPTTSGDHVVGQVEQIRPILPGHPSTTGRSGGPT